MFARWECNWKKRNMSVITPVVSTAANVSRKHLQPLLKLYSRRRRSKSFPKAWIVFATHTRKQEVNCDDRVHWLWEIKEKSRVLVPSRFPRVPLETGTHVGQARFFLGWVSWFWARVVGGCTGFGLGWCRQREKIDWQEAT